MPSSSRQPLERAQRLVVGDADVARAAGVAQPGVLGAGAGIVEAGADRVRLEDLAVLVLHDRPVGAVQDAAAPADGQRRAVAAGVDAPRPRPRRRRARRRRRRRTARRCRSRSSRRRRRRSRGRAAAPVFSRICARASSPMIRCRSRTSAGKRRRADARADHVVGVGDVGDPVADRRADRLLERARARRRPARRARPAAPCAGRWAPGGACPRCPCRRSTRGPAARRRWPIATPCEPAPVSAMIRVLPIRLASSVWPSALLILCAPVWLRSSRLR